MKEEQTQGDKKLSPIDYWATKWKKSYEENQSLRDQLAAKEKKIEELTKIIMTLSWQTDI